MKSDIRRRRVSAAITYNWNSGGGSNTLPWWLAGGLIPESTGYTIYDALGAADANAASVNLANPGVRDATTTGNAPSWAAGSGWSFVKASTNWLSMGTPFTSGKTLVIWFEDCINDVAYLFGNTKMYFWPYIGGSPNTSRIFTTGNLTLQWNQTAGILGIRAGQGVYYNGQKFGNIPALPAGVDHNMYLGAQNNGTAPTLPSTGKILRVALYDIVLSDAQMEAVWNSMRNYQLPSVDGYSSKIQALTPIAYYPCNQKYGQWLLDSVNNAQLNPLLRPLTMGEPGEYGYSVKGNAINGAPEVNNHFKSYNNDWGTKTGINLDECSVSFSIRNNNADVQVRPVNIYTTGLDEYLALEIRTGQIALFHRENGVTWNTSPAVTCPNNVWTKIVFYNSKSLGKSGFYVNGTKYEFNRTGTGFVNSFADGFPYVVQQMTGYMQHIAFYNRVLNQTEVNSLL